MKKSELRQLIREEVKKLNEIDSTKLKEMQDFLKPFLTGLTKVTSPRWPNSVFYKKNGEVIFEFEDLKYPDKVRLFWVDENKIWRVFYNKFKLDFTQIKLFIKDEVEKTLNLYGVVPICNSAYHLFQAGHQSGNQWLDTFRPSSGGNRWKSV